MYALAIAARTCCLGWNFQLRVAGARRVIVLVYIFLGGLTVAIYNEVLQFFLIVLGFLPLVLLGLKNIGGWHGLTRPSLRRSPLARAMRRRLDRIVGAPGFADANPMGVEWFGLTMGLGFVLVVWLLVHGLPGHPARDGGQLDDRGAPHAADRRVPQDAVPVPGHPAGHDRDRAAPIDAGGATGFALPAKMTPAALQLRPGRSPAMLVLHYFPTGMLGPRTDRAAWPASCPAWRET